MTDAPLVLSLADDAATARLGAALAGVLRLGDVVALDGDLGAGKTALARALIRAATGTADEEVPSPTFTLVQTYDGADGTVFWHFDLYRLEQPEDAVELDIDEAFAEGVALIEWPGRLGAYLPRRAVRLLLTITPDGGRLAEITNAPPRIRAALESL